MRKRALGLMARFVDGFIGKKWVGAIALSVLLGSCISARATNLLGLDITSGNVYNVNESTAGLTLLGNTGVAGGLGCLGLSPSNTLYSISVGGNSTLYTLNPTTYAATAVGPLGLNFVFEGALAFSPTGVAYGTNGNSSSAAQLFTVNLNTGAATVVGTMPGTHDINGLYWRSDGTLVGIDDFTNSLVTINPTTASIATVAALTPTLGAVGDLTVVNGTAYFATAGTGASIPGSNELWTVNLFTGADSLVGSFSPTIADIGISGLAPAPVLPEPNSIGLLVAGAFCLRRRRRR